MGGGWESDGGATKILLVLLGTVKVFYTLSFYTLLMLKNVTHYIRNQQDVN